MRGKKRVMSEFSNTLSQFIHEKNIKVYSLIKYCNFDRSTMYKIINGKRNPPTKETIDKMAEFMHLTPAEYSRCLLYTSDAADDLS